MESKMLQETIEESQISTIEESQKLNSNPSNINHSRWDNSKRAKVLNVIINKLKPNYYMVEHTPNEEFISKLVTYGNFQLKVSAKDIEEIEGKNMKTLHGSSEKQKTITPCNEYALEISKLLDLKLSKVSDTFEIKKYNFFSPIEYKLKTCNISFERKEI